MQRALEDIEYLSRSVHRVRVLERLAAGPADPRDLLGGLDVSRSTLGRTLEEFRERGWVVHGQGVYTLSPLGRTVLEAVSELVEVVEFTQALRPVAEYFPFDDVSFHPSRLADARVAVPTVVDQDGPLQEALTTVRAADRVSLTAGRYVRGVLDVLYEGVESGAMTVGLVVTPAVLAAIAADERVGDRFLAFLRSGAVSGYRYEGELPYDCVLADETVVFGLADDTGAPRGVVRTDDGVVHEWATARFAALRAASTPIPDGAPDDPPAP